MTKQIDGLEHAFANAGNSRPKGRAQRMADRVTGIDKMVEEEKIPRPGRIRRARPGAGTKGATPLPPVPHSRR